MSMKEIEENECVICFENIDDSKKYVQCCSCMKNTTTNVYVYGIKKQHKKKYVLPVSKRNY